MLILVLMLVRKHMLVWTRTSAKDPGIENRRQDCSDSGAHNCPQKSLDNQFVVSICLAELEIESCHCCYIFKLKVKKSQIS